LPLEARAAGIVRQKRRMRCAGEEVDDRRERSSLGRGCDRFSIIAKQGPSPQKLDEPSAVLARCGRCEGRRFSGNVGNIGIQQSTADFDGGRGGCNQRKDLALKVLQPRDSMGSARVSMNGVL